MKVPAAHDAHVPMFDCPGLQGQFTAEAQVRTVAPFHSCWLEGMEGQLYTSFSQAAGGEVHCPARYPPLDECQHSRVSGSKEPVSQEL